MSRNFTRLIFGALLAIPVAGGLFFIMQYLIATADPKIDDSKTRKVADILELGVEGLARVLGQPTEPMPARLIRYVDASEEAQEQRYFGGDQGGGPRRIASPATQIF